MIHPNALAAKVAAVNRANAEANRLFPLFAAALAPFVGQKITKVDGTLLESVKKALPELPGWQISGNRLNAYLTTGHGYSLRIDITVSENHETGRGYQSSQREEISVYLVDLTAPEGASFGTPRQYAKSIYPDHGPRRTDWTAEEVARLRTAYKAAQKVADDAKGALYPFGEYDR